MTRAVPGAAAVLLCGLLALASVWTPGATAAVLALLVAGLAVGWPSLLALPSPRGTAAVVLVAGAAALAVAAWPDDEVRTRGLAAVLALSVVLAFVHQMLRRDMRPRLAASVAGSVTGVALVALATGWVRASQGGTDAVLLGATSVAAAAAVSALPWPQRVTGALGLVASGAAAAAVAAALPDVLAWEAAVLGVVLAAVVAAVDRLLLALPRAASRRRAGVIGAVAVAACGIPVHVFARVIGG